jgi:hypothetical protein
MRPENHDRIILTGETEKPVPVTLYPSQIPHPVLRGERPVTNRLSHGTAILPTDLNLINEHL